MAIEREGRNKIENLMPWDTIPLVAPNSCVSPAGKIAGDLRDLEAPNLKFAINSVKDAEDFDFNLGLFVYRKMNEWLKTKYLDEELRDKAERIMTSEEKGEYDDILLNQMPRLYEKLLGDSGEVFHGTVGELSRLTHRLNQLRPSAWIMPMMSMAVYQYDNFDGLPLGEIYEICDGDRKKFNVFLDLKINFANLATYAYELVGAEWRFTRESERFDTCMDLQMIANAFSMSCRAVWDKVMGVIVLVGMGSEGYDNFVGASRKKKFFRKHIPELENEKLTETTLLELLEVIGRLDDAFRTQEVHGAGGKVRKGAFSDGGLSNSALLELIGHYNYVHEFLDNYWHDVDYLEDKLT